MKKLISLTILVGLIFCLSAQTPEGFNYQAVMRNTEGQPLTNQPISVRLTLQNAEGTIVYYTEIHSTTTSPQGIVSLTVGNGTNVTGNLTNIQWEAGGVNLKVEVDPVGGETFSLLGTSPLLAVPYALYALSGNEGPQGEIGPQGPEGPEGPLVSGTDGQTLRHDGTTWVASSSIHNTDANVGIGTVTPTEKLEVAGNIKAQGRLIGQSVEVNQPQPEEEPIFVVRNSAGQIVFAVYEGGVRAYVDDTGKQTRGGFAIGGLSDQTIEQEGVHYFSLAPDSVRFNIKTSTLKQTRGGFAVGGLSDQTKEYSTQNLLFIAPDSARIYVDNNTSKQTRGGFAIGGLSDQTKGEASNFLFLNPENYFIGHESGKNIALGQFNSFFGYNAGNNIKYGFSNIFIGYESGYSADTTSYNVFIGDKAGRSNTKGDLNVFIGNQAGFSNTIGRFNTFVGNWTGYYNTEGHFNTFYGQESGVMNTTGSENTFLGQRSGYSNETGISNFYGGTYAFYTIVDGNNNVGLGDRVAFFMESGDNNVFVGSASAFQKKSGNNNVFVGQGTGTLNEMGENNVFIGTESGMENIGSNNVFIGYRAGTSENGSNKLYISNKNTDSPLIYGEFDNNKLKLNAEVNIRDFMVLQPRDSAPSNPVEGTVYFDNQLKKLRAWDGVTWQDLW